MMGADCHATYYPMVVMARTLLSLAMYLNRAVMVEYALSIDLMDLLILKEHWYVDEIQKVQYHKHLAWTSFALNGCSFIHGLNAHPKRIHCTVTLSIIILITTPTSVWGCGS